MLPSPIFFPAISNLFRYVYTCIISHVVFNCVGCGYSPNRSLVVQLLSGFNAQAEFSVRSLFRKKSVFFLLVVGKKWCVINVSNDQYLHCAPFDCLLPFKNGKEEQQRFAQEHGSITYIIKHSIIRLVPGLNGHTRSHHLDQESFIICSKNMWPVCFDGVSYIIERDLLTCLQLISP